MTSGRPARSVIAVRCDVTDEAALEGATATVAEEFGGLDTVVLNAGGRYLTGTVEQGDSRAWRRTIELNLIGAYLDARADRHLRARGGGRIITIGSGLGQRGAPRHSAYAASKARLSMLTRVLAQELVEGRISVNDLVPGLVDTRDRDPSWLGGRLRGADLLEGAPACY